MWGSGTMDKYYLLYLLRDNKYKEITIEKYKYKISYSI